MSTHSARWLDRLTRRQALKAALAGASLTLPLGFVGSARAAGPSDCRTGCLYTSDRRYAQAQSRCEVNGWIGAATFLNPGLYVPAFGTLVAEIACKDAALLGSKARAYDCYQPNCSGFNPRGKDGPCEHAPKDADCCPCPGSVIGYVPCYTGCDPAGKCCAA